MSIFTLYTKYYPIKDEQTLLSFVKENRDCLIKICEKELTKLDFVKFRTEQKYRQQIKKEISFFGHVNLKNIAYNDALRKTEDRRLDKLDRNHAKITDMLIRLSNEENINMNETNELLVRGIRQFCRNIIPFIMAFLGIVYFLLICKWDGRI